VKQYTNDYTYCITQYPVLMKLHVPTLFDTRGQNL